MNGLKPLLLLLSAEKHSVVGAMVLAHSSACRFSFLILLFSFASFSIPLCLLFKYSGYRDKYTYPNFLDQKELDENRRQSGIANELG